jgi:hypothetical protein
LFVNQSLGQRYAAGLFGKSAVNQVLKEENPDGIERNRFSCEKKHKKA